MTLVEAALGMALLGTLLVALLVATGQMTAQRGRAERRLEACQAIDALLERAADLKIDRIWVDAINPRPRVWPAVAELLRAKFPELLQPYRKILFDEVSRAQYLKELRTRVDRAAQRLCLADRIDACM